MNPDASLRDYHGVKGVKIEKDLPEISEKTRYWPFLLFLLLHTNSIENVPSQDKGKSPASMPTGAKRKLRKVLLSERRVHLDPLDPSFTGQPESNP